MWDSLNDKLYICNMYRSLDMLEIFSQNVEVLESSYICLHKFYFYVNHILKLLTSKCLNVVSFHICGSLQHSVFLDHMQLPAIRILLGTCFWKIKCYFSLYLLCNSSKDAHDHNRNSRPQCPALYHVDPLVGWTHEDQ